MGKERDKLLWQTGGKPSDKSDEEAYADYMKKKTKAGTLPPHLSDTDKNTTTEE